MQAGSIVVLRTTGEKVFLIAENENGTVEVRRANVNSNGAITHEVNSFFNEELATLEDFANEQVNEMLLKAKVQKRLLDLEAKLDQEALVSAEPKPNIN